MAKKPPSGLLTTLKGMVLLPIRHHFWGSLAIVLVVAVAISVQIADRRGFADSELHQDVMERWGTPISQPAPSVRFVESGSVFTSLTPLPLAKQEVHVDAAMSYRKRGLVYFSGFDFRFGGRYEIINDRSRDIDLAFVFPIQVDRNRVLLSDLHFTVDGVEAPIDLAEGADRLVWTGKVSRGQRVVFDIAFAGRGLEFFTYRLDPALPVRDLTLSMTITGGDNYDYPPGVVPASVVDTDDERIALRWDYASLESGVPLGVILPSEQSFDEIIATMVRRAWAPFLLFFAASVALGLHLGRSWKVWEAYLLAAGYGIFFVLTAYLAAFMSFYLAYAISALAVGTLLTLYARWTLGAHGGLLLLASVVSFLVVPTLAVVAEGYTGLIYTLEILVGIATAMYLTSRPAFGELATRLWAPVRPEEVDDAA